MANETQTEQREQNENEETHETETEGEITPESVAELRRENAARRREARAAQQVADELRADLERFRVAQESEQEKAIREAVEAERNRLTEEFAGERLQNRLRARAAGRLADPEDAVVHLSRDVDPATDDAGIDAAIETLLAQKAYLAADAGNGNSGTRELVTQGPRSTAPPAGETSADDWIRSQRR